MEQVHADGAQHPEGPCHASYDSSCCSSDELSAKLAVKYWEAERHLPQQFGRSRVDHGDFASRIGWFAAVLSHDGQGGALHREVAKLDKFGSDTIATLDAAHRDVKRLSAAMAAALVTCTPREVATLVRRVLGADPGNGLRCWRAVTQWFRPRSVVETVSSMARLISPKRTKNVSELQVPVMQWELTPVEHESKFTDVASDSVNTAAMRAMLPRDMLDRLFDGPSTGKSCVYGGVPLWQ